MIGIDYALRLIKNLFDPAMLRQLLDDEGRGRRARVGHLTLDKHPEWRELALKQTA